jgi:hypothetical protein
MSYFNLKRRKAPRFGIEKTDGRIICHGHKKFVRGFGCCLAGKVGQHDGKPHVCEGPIDFHHSKTVGSGGGDETGVPLCRYLHMLLDSPGWSQKRVEESYTVAFSQIAEHLWKISPHGKAYRREREMER